MADALDFGKVDANLLGALRAYEGGAESAAADDAISVRLQFDGDLSAIEALGFRTHSVSGSEAAGVVRFRDLADLTRHPGVRWVSAGAARLPDLDSAVHDLRARASSAANVGAGGDGLWHAVVGTGVLTQAGDATGSGVLVAIIDTGIDVNHPMFMSQLTPTKKTRIKRIWDQGLTPTSVAECPDVALLESANTYGIEFDDAEIETALNGGPALKHLDCIGHGTHVAGIAAGGVVFPTNGDASKVGVAPEADLIVVKLLDTPDDVRFRLAAGFGAQVDFGARFRDAILWCLRTARNLGKPVVINMSFGSVLEPGDGLDDEARWVDERVDPTKPADATHFPTGAIVVKSSGNTGDVSRRSVAKITVPASGEITVPLELRDTRGALQQTWKECAKTLHKPLVHVGFWYRRATPHTAVTFALRLPHQSGFSGDMGVGGHLERGFVLRPGPPPSVAFVTPATNVHSAFVLHEGNPSVPHPDGGSVRRHRLLLSLRPKHSGGTVSYGAGTYEMKIKAPACTEIYAMCTASSWAAGKGVFFRIANAMADGSALAPEIDVTTPEYSSVDTFGRHVLTVGAYNDANGVVADPDRHAIASFSARGPLRDYSDPPGSLPLIATKPDIAAPGVKIDSAEGLDTEPGLVPRTPDWNAGIRFTEHSGTSMAAPMVAGVVALMLDKKPDLDVTMVRTILSLAARAGVDPNAPPSAHTNAYGSGMVDALQSHLDTP